MPSKRETSSAKNSFLLAFLSSFLNRFFSGFVIEHPMQRLSTLNLQMPMQGEGAFRQTLTKSLTSREFENGSLKASFGTVPLHRSQVPFAGGCETAIN